MAPKNGRRPRRRTRSSASPAFAPQQQQDAIRLTAFFWAMLQMMTPVMESYLNNNGFGGELQALSNPSDSYAMVKILRRERKKNNSHLTWRGISVAQMNDVFEARNAIAHNDLYSIYLNQQF